MRKEIVSSPCKIKKALNGLNAPPRSLNKVTLALMMFLDFSFVDLELLALIQALLVFQTDQKILLLYQEVFLLFQLQLALFTLA